MRTVHERLKLRRSKEQTVTPVTLNLPSDAVEDMKEVATLLGFTRVEALMRAYIGQGFRKDLERFNNAPIQRLADTLKKHGVSDEVIAEALAEAQLSIA